MLKDGVNDSPNNYTRFIAITNKLRIYEGTNRISVTLNLAHEAGSLNSLLNKFSRAFESTFYFDFEADICSSSVQNLLSSIALNADGFAFLGAYEEM